MPFEAGKANDMTDMTLLDESTRLTLDLLDAGRKLSQIDGFNGQVAKKTKSPRRLIWTMLKRLDSTPLLDMEEACSVIMEDEQ